MKSQVTWTKDEVNLLRDIGGTKILNELAVLFPRHSPCAISIKRKRLGIELSGDYISRSCSYNRSLVNEDNLCKLDQSLTIDNLSNEEYQVLVGCILGDGCIKKNGSGGKNRNRWKMRNFIFYCGHNDPQLDYNDWKAKMLSVFLSKTSRMFSKTKKVWKSDLWTVSHPIFTKLRDKFYATRYKCDKGIIPMDMVEKIDLLGLMIWYLDDGYLGVSKENPHHKKPYLTITAKGYKRNELEQATEILNRNLGLQLYVRENDHREGETCRLVCFTAKDRDKVLPIWQGYKKQYELPECMRYKLNEP